MDKIVGIALVAVIIIFVCIDYILRLLSKTWVLQYIFPQYILDIIQRFDEVCMERVYRKWLRDYAR